MSERSFMRVISQNGNVDLPYEKALIFHATETVLARCEGYDKEIVLGEYSSMEKAYKAMEMLREQHENVAFFKTIINTEKGASFVSFLSETEFDKMTQNYFQFPKDDEVEV